MKGYTCEGCGRSAQYLIENLCPNCFDSLPDYEAIAEARQEREAERRARRGEGDIINFIKREVKQ